MRHLLVRLIVNAAALFVAVQLIPGMHFVGGVGKLLLVALVFGLVNAVVRPVLTLLSCPLIVVTLGLFLLVINALMFVMTLWLVHPTGAGISRGRTGRPWLAALIGLVIGATLFVGRAAQT